MQAPETAKPPALGGRASSDRLQCNHRDREQRQPLGTTVMREHFCCIVHYTILQKGFVQTENKTYTKLVLGQKVSPKTLKPEVASK